MDLNTNASYASPGSDIPAPGSGNWRRNDAFSFWKLPQSWRLGADALIEESETKAQHYLYEKYQNDRCRRPSRMLNYYYTVKDLIPAGLRHRLNSLAINSRPRPSFPDWPCEDALLQLWRRALESFLDEAGAQDAWHVGFWPDDRAVCIVLTHDVESLRGLALMDRMADLEESYGFRSAWNLALEQYPVDWKRIDHLRSRGFEFGAHGLKHDGRLFRSDRDFLALAPRLKRIADEHGLVGFRAPSTLRRAEWIPKLGFEFDSSFSDTDIFEPQPGGTCSIFPFFLDSIVELPYTLPQDHTLIHLLGRELLPTWIRKARWIASLGGMILTLTHPDYCGAGIYLDAYERLLNYLAHLDNAWRALPSQVAQWWCQRAQTELDVSMGQPIITDRCAGARPRLLSQEPLARLECKTWREF